MIKTNLSLTLLVLAYEVILFVAAILAAVLEMSSYK